MPRNSSKASVRPSNTITSASVSKATNREIESIASEASQVLRDRSASKQSKSFAGYSMSQLGKVKNGGVAYHITGSEENSTVVASSTSVRAVKEATGRYRKVLSRLAKK